VALDRRVRGLADDDRGADLFRDRLEARREVHRVADRRVLEALLRPHRAHDGVARVDPDAVADLDAELRLPARRDLEGALLELEPGADGVDRVVHVLEGRVVERHDAVADVLVHGAAVPEDDLGHLREVFAEQLADLLRLELLGHRGEAAEVGEHHRDELPARRQAALIAVADDLAEDLGREELRQALFLALLADEVVDERRAVAEHEADGARHAVHPGVERPEADVGQERAHAPDGEEDEQGAQGA